MKTALCDRLGIEHPVILAPMAGATDAALVSAVAGAGGLGSHGCAAVPATKLPAEITAIRQTTNRPFNLNFFVHTPPRDNQDREKRLKEVLQPFFDELDLGPVPDAVDRLPPFGQEHLEALLADPPAIVSFHFGLPAADLLTPLKAAGCVIVSSATTVAEAQWLEANGADVVIAQGAEAGGHRGTFLDDPYGDTAANALIGTMALVPQIVDAVSLPVIAAGGIADGRGLAAALALGAQAVQIGTAFLQTTEAPIDATYRSALAAASGGQTRVTRGFSGRPARAIRNAYVDASAEYDTQLPDFPMPYMMNAVLRAAASKAGRTDLSSFWAGQAVAMGRPEAAADLVSRIVGEARAVLDALA